MLCCGQSGCVSTASLQGEGFLAPAGTGSWCRREGLGNACPCCPDVCSPHTFGRSSSRANPGVLGSRGHLPTVPAMKRGEGAGGSPSSRCLPCAGGWKHQALLMEQTEHSLRPLDPPASSGKAQAGRCCPGSRPAVWRHCCYQSGCEPPRWGLAVLLGAC